MEKPTLPKGTRDFGPAVMAKRQFILDTIKKVFQKFGFQPLETPAMENLTTLTGKYGDEGDQLLFRILDSGDYSNTAREAIAIAKETDDKLRFVFNNSFLKRFNEKRGKDPSETNPDIPAHFPRELKIEDETINEYVKKILSDNKAFIESNLEDIVSKNYGFIAAFNFSNNILFNHLVHFYRDKVNNEILNSKKLLSEITEKGLRYDLTVPFARYVVMNRNEIAFPFKRYQVQPVWRADRPQKGRYREFYQCDADVVGTNSLICEAEIILMIKETMSNLGVNDFTIKINHRGVLNGIAEVIGAAGKETDLFVAIDKLDKMSEEKVREELGAKGFPSKNLDTLFSILKQSGGNSDKLSFLSNQFKSSEAGQKGVNDLKEVFDLLKGFESNDNNVELDIALARGLSYYTGCIFEVKINNVGIGSISGGGRYDNLTASFGDKENLSGVGFSFGVDRLYDALEELNLFPKEAQLSSKILICYFDEETMKFGLKALSAFRKAGIASEIYPDQAKIKKQLDFANKKLIPFTIVIGSDEMKSGQLAFKNMESGEQEKLTVEQIIQKLNK